MNPFSGKPFYSYSSGRKLYKIDERFRGLGVKFENQNDCLVISSDVDGAFSGSIFTNAPKDLDDLRKVLSDDKFFEFPTLDVEDEDDDDEY